MGTKRSRSATSFRALSGAEVPFMCEGEGGNPFSGLGIGKEGKDCRRRPTLCFI